MGRYDVSIWLSAKTREDLGAAKARITSAFAAVDWQPVKQRRAAAETYGSLQLYDTPESAEAKFAAGGRPCTTRRPVVEREPEWRLMADAYEPSDATRAKLGWLTEQLEAVKAEGPERYAAMAEGMHVALASIRAACDQLDEVLAKVQQA